MKRLLYSLFLLVILCPVKLQAQEGQPLVLARPHIASSHPHRG